ncbi:MAG: hypothetical protein K9J37_02180 [Saprospiraceae bacterium]|nr:hypothetical protein [Saprospiraceae bacterium]MCF8248687.1 hypothetical protein [Saprospiraceae bacterium]MCF8278823.1 hypothetical protein [Bacteroidales bacterium]MCF8310623.1 hypothetical protein [Saprospiraceae bacterium]MCF8439182.1 hypothetical protein [Saprospiraceae bacterium]
MKKNKENILLHSLLLLSLAGYVILLQTERTDFAKLMTLYSALFAMFLYIVHLSRRTTATGLSIGYSIAIQLALFLLLPNLSDDYFRFIWDGQLAANGFSPYGTLPPEIHGTVAPSIPLADSLFDNLNALQKSNYTCYPPFNELFFVLPALVFPKTLLGNVVLMRLFIILANLGTALVGIRVLKALGRPVNDILFYSLNPLVIVELAGNLHFEALMVFFLVVAIHFAIGKKHLLAGVALALSVSVKLVPLALVPVFFRFFGWRKWVAFAAVTGGLTLLLFLPVAIFGGNAGFFKSIGLYFHNFEFNASIFYLLRQVGFWIEGYDMVGIFGPLLSLAAFALIMHLSFYRKNENLETLLESLLLALSGYYLLGTTVHPWYVTTLVALSVFTKFRYPVAWTFGVFFSYSAYANTPFSENPWLVTAEYLLVYSMLFWELRKYRPGKLQEKLDS